ncbi:DNA topoisomerase-1 [Enhydrobacter aerosaccus]|uniref:DNA topoisomerase n=2 Tax=Enhydrobacter aerosaccus TaxID=225324 RepID=A0A1T4TIS4_9HYPH|nr:DNA topoisomerase-1 [Enhydrobacter aerosaccus]
MSVEGPPDFIPSYQVIPRKHDTLRRLSRLVVGAEVYLATDPDREGESIAWHVADVLGLQAPKRVRFTELSEATVKAAVAKPERIDMALVEAQEVRRVWDRLVGYTVSPALSRRYGGSWSAGRVQSPAVRLVVEREREIRDFQAATYFNVRLYGQSAEGTWWLDLVGDGTQPDGRLTTRAVADRLAVLESVAVTHCADEVERENPPPPFTTSSLQQAASVELKFAPEKTMELAQALYEHGHITYHRTDNPNLGDGVLGAVTEVAEALGFRCVGTLRQFPVPRSAQRGHLGIAPSAWERHAAGETADERKLYAMIWRRALASQLEAAAYLVRRVEASGVDLGKRAVQFVGRRRVLQSPGWRALMLPGVEALYDAEDPETPQAAERDSDNALPLVKKGGWLRVGRGEVEEKKTRAPQRYSEASLIRRLEREGVGRPATYAEILRRIRNAEYVELKRRRLHATPRGEQLIDALAGRFGFVDLAYTREVEEQLDGIAAGEKQRNAVLGAFYDRLMDEVSGFDFGCPVCRKRPLRHMVGADRETGATYDYWVCLGERKGDCDGAFADKDGSPDIDRPLERRASAPAPSSGTPCPKCGAAKLRLIPGGVSAGGKRYGAFWRCDAPRCGEKFWDKPNTRANAPKEVVK